MIKSFMAILFGLIVILIGHMYVLSQMSLNSYEDSGHSISLALTVKQMVVLPIRIHQAVTSAVASIDVHALSVAESSLTSAKITFFSLLYKLNQYKKEKLIISRTKINKRYLRKKFKQNESGLIV